MTLAILLTTVLNDAPLWVFVVLLVGWIGIWLYFFKERNQIQIDQKLYVENVVLQYISDGQSADAATLVDPYAIKTIQAYIDSQLKAHNRNYNMGEKQLSQNEYIRERKILRARKADWSVEKIKRIVQKNTMAAPKS